MQTWKGASLHPSRFFAAMPPEARLGPAILYYLIVGIVVAAALWLTREPVLSFGLRAYRRPLVAREIDSLKTAGPRPADVANAQEILGCTIANCEEGGTGCECDATLGFECFATTASEEGEGICASIPGQCSTLVDPLLPEHVVPGGITADLICNEVDGISRVTYDISGKPPATIEWE